MAGFLLPCHKTWFLIQHKVRPMEAERGAQGEKGEGASASKGKGEEKTIEE